MPPSFFFIGGGGRDVDVTRLFLFLPLYLLSSLVLGITGNVAFPGALEHNKASTGNLNFPAFQVPNGKEKEERDGEN